MMTCVQSKICVAFGERIYDSLDAIEAWVATAAYVLVHDLLRCPEEFPQLSRIAMLYVIPPSHRSISILSNLCSGVIIRSLSHERVKLFSWTSQNTLIVRPTL